MCQIFSILFWLQECSFLCFLKTQTSVYDHSANWGSLSVLMRAKWIKWVDLMPVEMHVSNCTSREGGKVKVMSCSPEFWPRESGLCCFTFHLCYCHWDVLLFPLWHWLPRGSAITFHYHAISEGGKSVLTTQWQCAGNHNHPFLCCTPQHLVYSCEPLY